MRKIIAFGSVAIIALGACGSSSASKLPAGVVRNPGWTDLQLTSAYRDWTDATTGQGGPGGDGDVGVSPGTAEALVGEEKGLTDADAQRVLLLCEFNTLTLYVSFAQFRAVSSAVSNDLREIIKAACDEG
jgi:hypothetical protein